MNLNREARCHWVMLNACVPLPPSLSTLALFCSFCIVLQLTHCFARSSCIILEPWHDPCHCGLTIEVSAGNEGGLNTHGAICSICTLCIGHITHGLNGKQCTLCIYGTICTNGAICNGNDAEHAHIWIVRGTEEEDLDQPVSVGCNIRVE